MRIAMSAAAGLAVFFGTACGSTTGDLGSSTGLDTTGGVEGTTSGGGGGTTTGGGGAGTNGTGTGTVKLGDGTACSSNAACASGVCGINGSGNCCTTACKTDDATCAAAACDNTGACTYPSDGTPCNSACQYALFTASSCKQGACSAADPIQCPDQKTCNAAGTACEGSCDPANGAADCSIGWYCAPGAGGGVCTPQVQLGACTSNAACESNVCGVSGTGHCCTQSACTNVNSPTNLCGTLDCDGATGACTFPSTSTTCDTGPITCVAGRNAQADPNTDCNGLGTCSPPVLTDCSPYVCAAGGCLSSCTSIADCDKDFYCLNSQCVPQNAVGACTENDACLSFQCGSNGTGHCCFDACPSSDPACGIADCDDTSGACVYPGNSQACGSVLASCSNGLQQDPSVCNGKGDCPVPGTTKCDPFVCDTTTCFASCSSNAQCAAGDNCAASASVCCPALLTGGMLNVDGQNGSDSAACCGMPGYTECQTIGFAMQLIDTAQAANVTINAYLGGPGSGGDWPFRTNSPYAYNQPAVGDSVPLVLGWGVELNAPGVNFAPNWNNIGYNCDSNYNHCYTAFPAVIDVTQYSGNDTVGYVSIVGSASVGNVQIGTSSQGNSSSYNDAAVKVEAGQHLYIANALLGAYWYPYNYEVQDYSRYSYQAGIEVKPGGLVTFASDQSGAVTGQVVLGGPRNDNSNFWSCRGLVCETDGVSQGCTVDDVWLDGGISSLVISTEGVDAIEANDFSSIKLIGSPQFGNLPAGTGFRQCGGNKYDGYFWGDYYAEPFQPIVWLNGQADVNITGATVSCMWGDAFHLNSSPNGNGNPTLTLDKTIIQNTDRAIYASAGSVAATSTSIQYNYVGVMQDSDGTNTATIDLSGGGNTVACTDVSENMSANTYYCNTYGESQYCANPSAAVVNLTGSDLNADNVAWDTKGPDLFACTDSTLTSCTCQNSSCTVNAASDGMDAVYASTGVVDTAGASTSALDCSAPQNCGGQFCTGSESYCCFFFSEFYECTTSAQQCEKD